MNMQIGKWGNNLAVRLPKEMVERFGLEAGDLIDSEGMAALLQRTKERLFEERRAAALEEIRKGRIDLPADWKFDREEANWRPAMERW